MKLVFHQPPACVAAFGCTYQYGEMTQWLIQLNETMRRESMSADDKMSANLAIFQCGFGWLAAAGAQ